MIGGFFENNLRPTEWQSDQVTKWQEASQTIDRMVYFIEI